MWVSQRVCRSLLTSTWAARAKPSGTRRGLPNTEVAECRQGELFTLAVTAGSALDEPCSAMMGIEVLGAHWLWPCFRAHLGSTALVRVRTELSVALGVTFGQGGAQELVCARVRHAVQRVKTHLERKSQQRSDEKKM